MHNTFYASGFLYHPDTNQILLQQTKSADKNNPWVLLSADHNSEETVKDRFLDIIYRNLNLKLKPDAIFFVYNYTYQSKNRFIFYAQVNKIQNFINEKYTYTWFTFKQLHKLALSAQTRQDIIVGQRVIDSFIRKSLGFKTIG